ncbi:MAG: PIN domain-containing protein [Piptocephalis tieghemiana]|nr:MAG: PIN domain-containing protein [Piptocephalis tieghemiana]
MSDEMDLEEDVWLGDSGSQVPPNHYGLPQSQAQTQAHPQAQQEGTWWLDPRISSQRAHILQEQGPGAGYQPLDARSSSGNLPSQGLSNLSSTSVKESQLTSSTLALNKGPVTLGPSTGQSSTTTTTGPRRTISRKVVVDSTSSNTTKAKTVDGSIKQQEDKKKASSAPEVEKPVELLGDLPPPPKVKRSWSTNRPVSSSKVKQESVPLGRSLNDSFWASTPGSKSKKPYTRPMPHASTSITEESHTRESLQRRRAYGGLEGLPVFESVDLKAMKTLTESISGSSSSSSSSSGLSDKPAGVGASKDWKPRAYIVPDTNIFLHSLTFLSELVSLARKVHFRVVVPWVVIQELDGLKKNPRVREEAGAAIGFLHERLEAGDPGLQGEKPDPAVLAGTSVDSGSPVLADDKILLCASTLAVTSKRPTSLISDDRNMLVKAMTMECLLTWNYRQGGPQACVSYIAMHLPDQAERSSTTNRASKDVDMALEDGGK